jgi:hypothetical protein
MSADLTSADLLGGAERARVRARGFVPWKPQAKTLALLEQVQAVLAEYAAYLPLTLRQIFYRLIGAHGFDKSEGAYSRLGEHLNRARRAQLIDMSAIRDAWSDSRVPRFAEEQTADEWLDGWQRAMRGAASRLRLDRQTGQPSQLVVLCEAAGMVPQIAAAVEEWSISTYSSGGFDSTTLRHNFARQISDEDRPTEVLHLGDHDPSGVHMFLALAEDVQAFAGHYGGSVSFTRLAVTPEQIRDLALPTAPPKIGDGRAFTGQTCQCEAIAPDVLNEIVRQAVEERIEQAALRRVMRREHALRRELAERLQ